eukprot:gene7279-5123_t
MKQIFNKELTIEFTLQSILLSLLFLVWTVTAFSLLIYLFISYFILFHFILFYLGGGYFCLIIILVLTINVLFSAHCAIIISASLNSSTVELSNLVADQVEEIQKYLFILPTHHKCPVLLLFDLFGSFLFFLFVLINYFLLSLSQTIQCLRSTEGYPTDAATYQTMNNYFIGLGSQHYPVRVLQALIFVAMLIGVVGLSGLRRDEKANFIHAGHLHCFHSPRARNSACWCVTLKKTGKVQKPPCRGVGALGFWRPRRAAWGLFFGSFGGGRLRALHKHRLRTGKNIGSSSFCRAKNNGHHSSVIGKSVVDTMIDMK